MNSEDALRTSANPTNHMRRLLVLAATLALCAAEADPLRDAILLKGREELKVIAEKAGIEHEDDASQEMLQKLVYEYAQREKPSGVPRKQWDGTPMAEAKPKKTAGTPSPAATAGTAAGTAANMDGMSAMLFKSLDVDKDGKLSRSEMKGMLEKANAAAQAAGETVPADFFATLDTDLDGSVDRTEADAFFKKVAGGAQGAGGKAASSTAPTAAAATSGDDMSVPLFRAMDKDRDGALSREEMAMLVQKGNEANKAQGIPEVDFFEQLDWNNDGVVSMEESKDWFASMAKEMAAGSKGKEEL